jgi:hypothetical protein
LRGASTPSSYKVGWIIPLLFERCYIGINVLNSCTLVLWVLLLFHCVTFVCQVRETLELLYEGHECVCCFMKYKEKSFVLF